MWQWPYLVPAAAAGWSPDGLIGAINRRDLEGGPWKEGASCAQHAALVLAFAAQCHRGAIGHAGSEAIREDVPSIVPALLHPAAQLQICWSNAGQVMLKVPCLFMETAGKGSKSCIRMSFGSLLEDTLDLKPSGEICPALSQLPAPPCSRADHLPQLLSGLFVSTGCFRCASNKDSSGQQEAIKKPGFMLGLQQKARNAANVNSARSS